MSKLPDSQLELIKKSFGIENWDSLLSSCDRHIEILLKAHPPLLQKKYWHEGGSPDWILAENLLSGRMQDAWPKPTAFEIIISERLNALIHEYLEFGGWSNQHDVWLSRYENFVNAVRSNKLNDSE